MELNRPVLLGESMLKSGDRMALQEVACRRGESPANLADLMSSCFDEAIKPCFQTSGEAPCGSRHAKRMTECIEPKKTGDAKLSSKEV